MKKLILPLGIVLILVGGVSSIFVSSQQTVPTWMVIFGVILVAVYVVANWQLVAKRSTFYGLNALMMSAAVVAILTVVYLIADNRDRSWDLTASGKYTLDPQTASILDGLETEVKMLVFAASELRMTSDFAQTKDLLDEYNRHNSLLTYKLIDPSKDYETAIQYQKDLNPLGQLTVIAEMAVEELGEGGEAETRTFREKAAGNGQEEISNAIKKVTHREAVTAYFLVGHYERELSDEGAVGLSNIKNFLAQENIEASPLRLGVVAEIPEDARIVALVGPQEDLTETELAALEQYVLRGGGLFVALDPGDLPATTQKLRDFGYEIGNDLLIQMEVGAQSLDDLLRGRMTASPSDQVQLAEFDASHEITKELGNSTVRLRTARSVGKMMAPPEGIEMTELAKTEGGMVQSTNIPASWADKRPEDLRSGNVPVDQLFDSTADTKGPVTAMMVADIDLDRHADGKPSPDSVERKGKVVVIGDSDFMTNAGMQVRGGISRGHLDLSLNVFNWLAGQVDLITIRKPQVVNTSVTLDQDQKDMLKKLFVWVIPTLIGLVGIAVVIYRRWMYV